MRVMVFFDLPIKTRKERRDYARFRRFLIKSGFYMMQESVYCKICLNGSGVRSMLEQLRINKPSKGIAQVLTVTERQYAKMEYITGTSDFETICNDRRTLII